MRLKTVRTTRFTYEESIKCTLQRLRPSMSSGRKVTRWDPWDDGRALDLSDADGTGNYVDLRCQG